MIHDILMSLLAPNRHKLAIAEFLKSELSQSFLHPAEHQILEDIVKIANQHKNIRNFILDYGTQSRCQINGEDEIDESSEEPLLKGLYLQAFADGIDRVLDTYRNAITDLEQRYLMKPTYSLLFIYQKVDEFRPLFVFLLKLIAGIRDQKLHGCAILQYLQQHSLHGNPKIMEAVRTIKQSVHVVFLKQLSRWLIYGKFVDIYGEFFIQHIEQKNSSGASDRQISGHTTTATPSDGTSVNTELWRYEISYELLPQSFSCSWAEKVLFIGQTVLMFNADAPHEVGKKTNAWNQEELDFEQKGSLWNNQEHIYFNKIAGLHTAESINIAKYEEIVDEIKFYISERLSEIAINQADLIKQLKLIKEFFLLGRGELYLEFIKQTAPISRNNVNETTARDITKAFQSAAYSINLTDDLEQFAMYIPIEEVDSRGYDFDNRGFIRFIKLRYKVKWPLHLLFSPQVIERYNVMFQFLLQIKRIQYDLHMVWCHQREKKMKKNSELLQFCNKLIFLIHNLQYYLQVDVLEAQFSILMNIVQNSKDFENIQRTHTIFQANVLSQCFLLSNDANMNKSTIVLSTDNPVLTILNRIMQRIAVFCKLSLTCSDPMTKDEHQLFEICERFFTSYVDDLMKLLIGLKAGPSSAPLAQLLLRLDYNYWFSSQQAKFAKTCS